MIHNHEVPSSILGPATNKTESIRALSYFFIHTSQDTIAHQWHCVLTSCTNPKTTTPTTDNAGSSGNNSPSAPQRGVRYQHFLTILFLICIKYKLRLKTSSSMSDLPFDAFPALVTPLSSTLRTEFHEHT